MKQSYSWMKTSASKHEKRLWWQRLVLPTLIPLLIGGGLLAAFTVPAMNRQIVVLSLFLEPIDGTVVGVNGPHRFFPVQESDSPLKSSSSQATDSKESKKGAASALSNPTKKSDDEYNDLASLANRIQHLHNSDKLVLMVSAVAVCEQDRVLLIPTQQNATDSQKLYLQDLIRTVNQANAAERLVVLDIQWPTDPEAMDSLCGIANLSDSAAVTDRAKKLHDNITRLIRDQLDRQTTYVLSADEESWAQGMENPRQSAFLHFWNDSLSSDLTDSNHDGRLSIREVVETVQNGLADWSRENCSFVQAPILIGNHDFDLGPIQKIGDANQLVPTYPAWLTDAWATRDAYLSRFDIPVDSKFLDLWQRKLLAIESRWRRAINDAQAEADIQKLNQWASEQIAAQITAQALLRPDSLWLASKAPMVSAISQQAVAASLEQIIQHLSDIKTLPTDPATLKAVEKVVADQIKVLQVDLQLCLLDRMIAELCSQASRDELICLAAINLATQLKVENNYAETIVLTQAIATERVEDGLAHALLRLTRIRSQLGDRSLIFSVMSHRLDSLLEESLTAQQFYWFDGFTTDELVRGQVTAAVTRLEIGLSQQHCIERAISTVEQAIAFLQCGQALPHHELSFVNILKDTEKLSRVLYQPENSLGSFQIDAAAVRFENIRYLTEQLRSEMQGLVLDAMAHANTCSCDALLSIVPASSRGEVYERLLSGKQLQSIGRSTRRCLQSTEAKHSKASESKNDERGQIDLADFMARIATIESLIAKAKQSGESAMGLWLQHLAQVSADTHDPTEFYQQLANRMRFRGSQPPVPTLTSNWDVAPISWENRRAKLLVQLSDTEAGLNEAKLTMLETASASLQVVPNGTVVTPQRPGIFQFDLGIHSDQEMQKTLRGVWLRWDQMGSVRYIPVRFPAVQSCQLVELNMNDAVIDSPSGWRWRLWPKSDTQSFDWNLINHDTQARNVVVTINADNGFQMKSAPIPLPTSKPTPVRFPGAALTAPPQSAGQDELNSAKSIEEFTVTVSDAKTNETLLQRAVQIELMDARGCVDLASAAFNVSEHGGANSLTIELAGTDASDPLGHYIRLGLTPDHLPTFRKIGSGSTSTQLFPHQSPTQICLKDLSIEEGRQDVWHIPLIVDGDAEAIQLSAATPYVGGRTDWKIDLQPRVFVQAPVASVPGETFGIRVGGMNMSMSEKIIVQFGQRDSGKFNLHHQEVLSAPRRRKISFATGGPSASINVNACYDRWEIDIPTDPIAGKYELRILTGSNNNVLATSNVLLDSQMPRIISVSADAKDLTKLKVRTLAGPSGIDSVSLLFADKSKVLATVGDDPNQWLIQAKQPVSTKEPTVVTLQATSVAGKTVTVDSPVTIETPSTTGLLRGVVIEGTIPQPKLSVVLTSAGGNLYKLVTDQDGIFQGSVPVGSYKISVEKKSTGRRAATSAKVQSDQATELQLELLLPSRQTQA